METQTNPPAGSPETKQLESELKQLRQRNAELERAANRVDGDEKIIRKKMGAGLTREQAVAAIKHQREFGQRLKEVTARRKQGGSDRE